MKFGKQLALALWPPWRDRYFQYNKLKRMISRYEQEKEKEERKEKEREMAEAGGGEVDASGSNSLIPSMGSFLKGTIKAGQANDDETRPLNEENVAVKVYGDVDPDEQRKQVFMEVVNANIEHVNAFFVGKEAELQGLVLDLERASSHPYMMEFKGDISHYKKVYQEIIALQKFVELNREAARKIVKKFDKVMGASETTDFVAHLNAQPFSTSGGPEQLVKRMQALISRDKLLKLKQEMAGDSTGEDERIFSHVKPMPLLIAVSLGAMVLVSRVLHHSRAAHHCLALLVFTITAWSTEALPYFATALLVPVLVVLLGILEDPTMPGVPLPAEASANVVLSNLVNHTTILILGGYAVAAAFSRCEVELQLASFLQRRLGHKPQLFMLALMFLGLFLSAVISNHTSPVLCISIIAPIIRDFEPDSRYTKALLLGIAFACNFGGMMTPISSMQDALAVSYLQAAKQSVSFGKWILMAVPTCTVLTAVCWIYLIALYQPDDVKEIPTILCSKDSLSRKDWVVVFLSLATMLLWSTLEFTKDIFGDLGIISLIFLVIIFGSGMLTQIDFNSFNWHTLFLLGGGSVLGKAIASSHLLEFMVSSLFDHLPADQPIVLVVGTLTLTLVISTFVSHTVAALILMPIVVQLGVRIGDAEGLAVTAALAISAAMALPFSSFPNVIILSTLDDFEKPYLQVKDFLIAGLPMSIIALLCVGTLGYTLVHTFF